MLNKQSSPKVCRENKWRRGFKACLNCRSRKVKCDLGPLDEPHEPPCDRCKREGKICEFSKGRKRNRNGRSLGTMNLESSDEFQRRPRTTADAAISGQKSLSGSGNNSNCGVKWKFDTNSMQSALVFLAKAAGSVADQDNQTTAQEDDRMGLKATRVADLQQKKDPCNGSFESLIGNSVSSSQNIDNTSKTADSLAKKVNVRSSTSAKLTDIEYIGSNKLISQDEAVKLIDVFFSTMHPFFPHIPLQLHDPEVLVRYPLLLCAIITISARYHAFHELGLEDDDQHRRHIQVHEQLWVYCQKLISQTIWAEASTRSIGTVLAFLLFTEWNPRAIHWNWPDYANQGELKQGSRTENPDWTTSKDSGAPIGMAAIRRSDRMNWMLTGTAVRLAQDMGLLEISSKIFTAAHIAETYTAMDVGQRSTLAESLNETKFSTPKTDRDIESTDEVVSDEDFYLERALESDESRDRWSSFLHEIRGNSVPDSLADIELEFLNDEYVLYYADGDYSGQRHAPDAPSFPLRLSQVQRAKIELLRIISIGYDSIYNGKDRQQLLLNDPRRNLALLHIISTLIDSWNKTYQELLKPANGPLPDDDRTNKTRKTLSLVQLIDGESLICEYYYCQLYIYSLALQVDARENQLKLNEITRSAKYVELAYNAAKELLASAARLQRLQLLKCVPVRWIVRIVRSVAFIVKCYMTLMGNTTINDPLTATILKLTVISTEELLQTIQSAAIVLKEASPDEVHLCTRYSTILMYLCSELQHNDQEQPASPEHDDHGTTTATTTANDYTESLSLQGDVIDWFTTSDEIGLDFVESWTEMIEQRYLQSGGDAREQLLEDFYDQLPANSSHSPHKQP